MVTGLVLEDGGDEDQAIAAMLHDAVEDGGGRAMLAADSRARSVRGSPRSSRRAQTPSTLTRRNRGSSASGATSRICPRSNDDAILRVALADKVHNARSIVRDYREEGHALWERFAQKTPRQQLWYYGGLLEFYERHRPGPLTEDLRRAISELAWLVARDDAQRSDVVRLWLDADLHQGQAPTGWVQVRTPEEATELLRTFHVRALSLPAAPGARHVVEWLTEQAETGPSADPVHPIASDARRASAGGSAPGGLAIFGMNFQPVAQKLPFNASPDVAPSFECPPAPLLPSHIGGTAWA